jgi:hypothetical protein
MLFWVCVDDKPIALPTKSAEEAKQLALEQLRIDASANVQIDVYPGNSQPMEAKLRYQAKTRSWISTRPN